MRSCLLESLTDRLRQLRNELDELKAHRQPSQAVASKDQTPSLESSGLSWVQPLGTAETISPSFLLENHPAYEPTSHNPVPSFGDLSQFQTSSHSGLSQALTGAGTSHDRSVRSIPAEDR